MSCGAMISGSVEEPVGDIAGAQPARPSRVRSGSEAYAHDKEILPGRWLSTAPRDCTAKCAPHPRLPLVSSPRRDSRKSGLRERKAAGGGAVDFSLTEREAYYRDRVRDFIETRIRPRNERLQEPARRRRPLAADRGDRGAEARGQRGRPVEPVHAAGPGAAPCRRELRVRRHPAHQPRICALRRGDGPDRLGRARCSTAPRPTPATWRCSTATARASRRSSGCGR